MWREKSDQNILYDKKNLFLIKIGGLAAALAEATVMVGMRLSGGIIQEL